MAETPDISTLLQSLLGSIFGNAVQGGSQFLTNTLLNQIDPGRAARFETLPATPLGQEQAGLAQRLAGLESIFAQFRPAPSQTQPGARDAAIADIAKRYPATPEGDMSSARAQALAAYDEANPINPAQSGTQFNFGFTPISQQIPGLTSPAQTSPEEVVNTILQGITPGLTRTFENRREDILANFAAAGAGSSGDIANRLIQAERDLIFNPAAEAASKTFETARQFNMTDLLQRLGLAQTGELAGATGGLQAQQATEQSRQFNLDNILKNLQASLLPQTVLASMRPEERDILGFPSEPSLAQQISSQRQLMDTLALLTGGKLGGTGTTGGLGTAAGATLGGAASTLGSTAATGLLKLLGLAPTATTGTAGGATAETIVNQLLGGPTGPQLMDPNLATTTPKAAQGLIDTSLTPTGGTPVDAYGLIQQILSEGTAAESTLGLPPAVEAALMAEASGGAAASTAAASGSINPLVGLSVAELAPILPFLALAAPTIIRAFTGNPATPFEHGIGNIGTAIDLFRINLGWDVSINPSTGALSGKDAVKVQQWIDEMDAAKIEVTPTTAEALIKRLKPGQDIILPSGSIVSAAQGYQVIANEGD